MADDPDLDFDLNDEVDIEDDGPAQPSASAGQARRAPRGPAADDARKILQNDLTIIVDYALTWLKTWGWMEPEDRPNPPQDALKVETGVGKSEMLRQVAVTHFIPEAKRAGLPYRVLKLVPTHRLAGEAASAMPSGVSVAVWQGRGGTHLETGELMCLNPTAVEAALKVGAVVEKTACRHKTMRCPFYAKCHFQAQKLTVRKADIVYAAHEILFQMPKSLGKQFGLAVVDEGFWQDGINTKARLVISSLDEELKNFPVRDYNGMVERLQTERLGHIIERLKGALDKMPDGYVQRQPLLDADIRPGNLLNEAICSIARKAEWRRKVKLKLYPGADDETQKAVVGKYSFLGRLPRRAAMWRHLEDLIAGNEPVSGRLRIETEQTADGPQRYLRILARKEIAEPLNKLPLIVADATMNFELVQHFFSKLDLARDLKVEASHMRITQLTDIPVGKSSLQELPPGKRSDEKEARVARKRQRLVAATQHLFRGRRGLVITYQSIEDEFAEIENSETGHFGAIEGVDKWGDVEVAMVIGRPLPRSEDIERMAAAVTGMPVIAGDMVEQLRQIIPDRWIQCRVYQDPTAEMVRQAVTEAAIEQAVGRARGVNRTINNPVEIFMVLSDTVTGLPVDEVATFQSIEPDAIDSMIDRGWDPELPSDAAKLCPDLFRNREAAKKAYQRDRSKPAPERKLGTFPYNNDSIRRCPQFSPEVICFRVSGRGQVMRYCMVDRSKVSDPKAALEVAWKRPMADYEVIDPKPMAAE